MRKGILLLTVVLGIHLLHAQDETIFLSLDAEVSGGYTPWKSFREFRNTYNSTNAETLKNKLGSLSPQYGYSYGIDCFIENHLYTSVDVATQYARTDAKFDNGAKRLIRYQSTAITSAIGWLQPTNNGYWTLVTGFTVAFGNLRSFIEFADGTRYVHTGGLSGEFHDYNIGVPLRYEWNKNLTDRWTWRSGIEAMFYFETSDLGMQNAFVTQTAGSLALNDAYVRFDISGIRLYTGLSFKLVKHNGE